MHNRTLFCLVIIACSYCFTVAMDKPARLPVVVVDKGLLTEINGIVQTKGSHPLIVKNDPWLDIKRDTIAALIAINYEKSIYNPVGSRTIKSFAPKVLKVLKILPGACSLDDLGSFSRDKHIECEECIRCNQALYIPEKQGAFLYSTDEKINLLEFYKNYKLLDDIIKKDD